MGFFFNAKDYLDITEVRKPVCLGPMHYVSIHSLIHITKKKNHRHIGHFRLLKSEIQKPLWKKIIYISG